MANVTITLECPEATLKRVVKALCEAANIEESNANAKAELVRIITEITLAQERKNAAIAAVEGLK